MFNIGFIPSCNQKGIILAINSGVEAWNTAALVRSIVKCVQLFYFYFSSIAHDLFESLLFRGIDNLTESAAMTLTLFTKILEPFLQNPTS